MLYCDVINTMESTLPRHNVGYSSFKLFEHDGMVTWTDDDTSCYVSDTSRSLLSDADDEMTEVDHKMALEYNEKMIVTIDQPFVTTCDVNNNKQDDAVDDVIRPMTSRWFVLGIICFSIFNRSFLSVVFGQINDVISDYYVVSPGAADWLTNSATMATLVSVPLVAMAAKRGTNLRKMALWMTGSASLGSAMLTMAMTNRKFGFAVAILGQSIMGINNAIAMSIPPLVAAVWFPESELTSSMASAFIAVGAGDAMGSIIPPTIVTSKDGTMDDVTILEQVRFRLIVMFSVISGLTIVTFFIAIAFLEDKPEVPPSKARLLRQKPEYSLLGNKEFALVAILYGVSAASGANSVTLLSSLTRDAMREIPGNYDVVSGQIMTLMFICFSIGPFIAGRALDRNKKFQTTALIGLAGSVVGTTGITWSLSAGSIIGLMTSHAILGSFMGIAETALFEVASEVTFPHPEMMFSCILVTSWMAFFIVHPIVGRIALGNSPDWIKGSTLASLPPTIFAVASFVIAILFLRPTYNRRKATMTSERTPLL